MGQVDIVTVGLLLSVACLVAIVTRKIGLPYSIGLVAAGIALSIGGYHSRLVLTPQLIFTLLLPPLVFEAALHLGWRDFRREAPLILNLAFLGTLVSAAVVAAGMRWLVGWSWGAAVLFGSLIAAVDPVAVIALLREQNADRRLRFLMESESLLNDGAAAVMFTVTVSALGSGTNAGAVVGSLVWTVAGGVGCGLLVAWALMTLAGGIDDHLVELTITVLIAYGSFLIAEEIQVSGVLATVSAGMLAGNWGTQKRFSQRGQEATLRFWEFAAFLANSVIFLLIGSREADQPLGGYIGAAAIAIALVVVSRAAAVYPFAALFRHTRNAVDRITQHIMFWGGLRGALGLALALAAPAALPERDALVSVAFAVVAFSIFVQGLTVPILIRKAAAQSEEARAAAHG